MEESQPRNIFVKHSISQQCWKFLTGAGVCNKGTINLTPICVHLHTSWTIFCSCFVQQAFHKHIFERVTTMSWMFAVDVVFQRQPLHYHDFTMNTWDRHLLPEHVVDHALLSFANHLLICCLCVAYVWLTLQSASMYYSTLCLRMVDSPKCINVLELLYAYVWLTLPSASMYYSTLCLRMVDSPKCISSCSCYRPGWSVRTSQSLLSLHLYDCYSLNTTKRAIKEIIRTPSRVPVPFVCNYGKLDPAFHQIWRKAPSAIYYINSRILCVCLSVCPCVCNVWDLGNRTS